MLGNVGMAVPKTTETRCRNGSVQARQLAKDYTSNPIPTSFFILEVLLRVYSYEITGNINVRLKKEYHKSVSTTQVHT